MKRPAQFTLIAVILAVWLSGCAPAATPTPTAIPTATPVPPAATLASSPTPVPFELSSSAFTAHQAIPDKYACHGKNISPPLTWSGTPAGTESFTIILDDPDAVKVIGYIWVHWVLFNLPAQDSGLNEGIADDAHLPDGSLNGMNGFSHYGYGGPCPPNGSHNYRFTLYALDSKLTLDPGSKKDDVLQAIQGHGPAQAELIGKYP